MDENNRKKVNIVAVFSPGGERVLMCRRLRPPFKGLLNFPGGHVEEGETDDDAARRELYEETGITGEDAALRHLLDINYCLYGIELQVYCGRLTREVTPSGEENPLEWVSADADFCDEGVFAGTGSLRHVMRQIKLSGLI